MVSVFVGAYVRMYDDGGNTLALIESSLGMLWPKALAFTSVMMLGMFAMGLHSDYPGNRICPTLLRIAVGYALGGIALTLLFYLVPAVFIGRGVFVLSALISFVGISTLRFFFIKVVDKDLFLRRVLVYGSGSKAAYVKHYAESNDHQVRFKTVGYVRTTDDRSLIGTEELVQPNAPLSQFARDRGADEIVIAVDDRRNALPVEELLECRMSGIQVTDLPTFFEREARKIRLDLLSPSWIIFSEGFNRGGGARSQMERIFDIVSSSLLLLISWPFMLITALAIKIEDGWHSQVLYRQVRVGQAAEPFEILKFRSMREDAEKDGAQWAREGDDRVTLVGAIIRQLRIDELPQIFNVLRGDMSFVGPRPERPEFVEDFIMKLPYYSERHRVKPGVTGWAQLRYPYGASDKDALEKLQYDLYYAKNHSLLFDLLILLNTAEVVVFGKGAR